MPPTGAKKRGFVKKRHQNGTKNGTKSPGGGDYEKRKNNAAMAEQSEARTS